MKVFISWSKAKSMQYALKTKALLESLDPSIKAFVSEVDIHGGEDVQEKIIQKIIECDKLVLCFTKENKKSPWLLFEAGYARGLKKTVVPMLFDDDPNWHSWVDNPMNVAREINFNYKNFTDVFLDCFGIVSSEKNKQRLQRYKKAILDIKDKFRQVDIQCEDFVDKLTQNEAFIVENPFYRDKVRRPHCRSGILQLPQLAVMCPGHKISVPRGSNAEHGGHSSYRHNCSSRTVQQH